MQRHYGTCQANTGSTFMASLSTLHCPRKFEAGLKLWVMWTCQCVFLWKTTNTRFKAQARLGPEEERPAAVTPVYRAAWRPWAQTVWTGLALKRRVPWWRRHGEGSSLWDQASQLLVGWQINNGAWQLIDRSGRHESGILCGCQHLQHVSTMLWLKVGHVGKVDQFAEDHWHS